MVVFSNDVSSEKSSPCVFKKGGPRFVIALFIHFDNKRAGFNGDNDYLKLNAADDEGTSGDRIDFLSNGFKCRSTSAGVNASGGSYIYMAFAEEPLVANSGTGVPATAR